MKELNTHIIHKVFFEVNTGSLKIGEYFKNNFLEYLKMYLFPLLEQRLSSFSNRIKNNIRLSNLEIELSLKETNQLEECVKQIVDQIITQIDQAVQKELLHSKYTEKSVLVNQQQSNEQLFVGFLKQGRTPWWGTNYNINTEKIDVAKLFDNVEGFQNSVYKERLIKQFTDEELIKLIANSSFFKNKYTENDFKTEVLGVVNQVFKVFKNERSLNLDQRFLLWDIIYRQLFTQKTSNNKQIKKLALLLCSFNEKRFNDKVSFVVSYLNLKLTTMSILKVLINLKLILSELESQLLFLSEQHNQSFVSSLIVNDGEENRRISNEVIILNHYNFLLAEYYKTKSNRIPHKITNLYIEFFKIVNSELLQDFKINFKYDKEKCVTCEDVVYFNQLFVDFYKKQKVKSFSRVFKTKEGLLKFKNAIIEINNSLNKFLIDQNLNKKAAKSLKNKFSKTESLKNKSNKIESTENINLNKKEENQKSIFFISEKLEENASNVLGQRNQILANQNMSSYVNKSSHILQKEFPFLQRNPKKLITELGVTEELFIDNAGLILVHPFLKYFFTNLDLFDAKNNTIVNSERAAHLLHYVATGNQQSIESNMLFEKIICGIPLQDPINRFLTFSDKEKEESQNMLKAVLSNWEKMENSSIALLQHEFLQRRGKLLIHKNTVTLYIERKTQDILLNKINWNIAIVKLPWLNCLIQVQW